MNYFDRNKVCDLHKIRASILLLFVLIPLSAGSLAAELEFKSAERLIKELDMDDRQLMLRGASRKAVDGGGSMGSVFFPADSGVMDVVSVNAGEEFGRTDITVQFEYNSAMLTEDARKQLSELGKAMTSPELHDFQFEVVGHTDSVGSDSYNLKLSERRARSVKQYLIQSHGIGSHRMVPVGLGEEQLSLPDDPENAANRRVEVVNIGRSPVSGSH